MISLFPIFTMSPVPCSCGLKIVKDINLIISKNKTLEMSIKREKVLNLILIKK